MDALEQRLTQIIFAYWQLPEREGRVFLKLLLTSPCARVVVLRNQMALAQTRFPTTQGVREVDLAHVFHAVLTPIFVMAMLRDLASVGSLSHGQCAVIEECLLDCVSAQGTWKTVEPRVHP